jgi:ABC-2 type transport system ATP-binding protein
VPVEAAEGLTTRVVRALDQAGVQVNDVTMQRASLDDVFLSLTGRVTAPAGGTAGDGSEDAEGSEAA